MATINSTLLNFGYPGTLIHEYRHWVVLLRPVQVTLGSLVIGCKEEAVRLGDVDEKGFLELGTVIRDLESVLREVLAYDKINYLMLMMVDPHVHYHVIPRYRESRDFDGSTCSDASWPGPPDLSRALDLTARQTRRLREELVEAWQR